MISELSLRKRLSPIGVRTVSHSATITVAHCSSSGVAHFVLTGNIRLGIANTVFEVENQLFRTFAVTEFQNLEDAGGPQSLQPDSDAVFRPFDKFVRATV